MLVLLVGKALPLQIRQSFHQHFGACHNSSGVDLECDHAVYVSIIYDLTSVNSISAFE